MTDTRVEAKIEAIVRSYDCLLVDLVVNTGGAGHGGQLLISVGAARVGDSVTADRCAQISHAISDMLESDNLDSGLGERYTLEVGTPGLTRKLKSERELAYARGRNVRIVGRPTDDNKGGEVVTGVLVNFDPQGYEIDTGKGLRVLSREAVKTIHLDLLAAPIRARR